MNVYDFDKTIYDGDSTADFYFYCLKKHPKILLYLPYQGVCFLLFMLGIISKTSFKQSFFIFFKAIYDIDNVVNDFWDMNEHKIKKLYIDRRKGDDIIISASPEFLLTPICKRLSIHKLIASVVDKNTGVYTGLNCYGKEKLIRLNKEVKNYSIDEFYSDSMSDKYLAEIAKKSYIVKGDDVFDWTFLS